MEDDKRPLLERITVNPGITEEDIRACVAYGAEMTRERFVEVRPGA